MKRKIISIHPESLKANAVTEELAGRIAQWAMTMSSLVCLRRLSLTQLTFIRHLLFATNVSQKMTF
jgi:hypothetical protein